MKNTWKAVIIALLCLVYALSSCTGISPVSEETPSPVLTVSPSPTVSPTPKPTVKPSPTPPPTPSPEEVAAQEGLDAANLCWGFIGTNYKYGGKTPESGFDCSGLVYYVYSQLGYTLERVANAQSKQGILIEKDNMQPGDVLCFGAPDYCGHVGVYVGDGWYIHAMGAEFGVVLTSLDDPYIKRPKYEARRIAGCEWLKTEVINAALAAGEPFPTPPAE